MECIAIHLDVELGVLEIWKQLAACLLLLDQRWEKASRKGKFVDRGQLPEIGEEPNIEQENKSLVNSFLVWMKEIWEDRSPWWKLKHFHEKSVDVEQQRDGKRQWCEFFPTLFILLGAVYVLVFKGFA